MTEAERALKRLCVYLRVGARAPRAVVEDYESRDLVVTPFGGAYGEAGVIVALNGSPPRGLFLVTRDAQRPNYIGCGAIWFDGGKRARALGEGQAGIVTRFLREMQNGGEVPATEEGEV